MKKWFFILSLWCVPLSLLAFEDQGSVPDSLVLRLQQSTGDDYQRAKALEDIIDYYIIKEEYDYAKPYVDDIIRLSETLKNNYVKVLSCFYKVIYLNKANDLQAAVPYLYEARTLMEGLDDDVRSNRLRLRIYNELALFYYSYDMLPQAYEYLNQCFRINEKLNSDQIDFNLNRRLMMLFGAMGKYRECIALGKSLSGIDARGIDKAYYYMIMMDSYASLGEIDSALQYIDSAFMCEGTERIRWLIYDRKGDVYWNEKEYDEAFSCFEKMLQAADSRYISREDSLYVTYRMAMGKAMQCNNDYQYDSALHYINQSLDAVRWFVSLHDECKIMDLKTEILKNGHRYEEALENVEQAKLLSDSLLRTKDVKNIESLMFQQKMAEYEAQQQYENYVRESKYRIRVLIVVVIALLFMSCSIILILIMKRRKFQHQLVEEELEERNREIASAVVVMKKKNEVYTDVINQLRELKEQTENRGIKKGLTKISSKIEQTMEDDFYDEFDLRFRRVHPDFIEKLTKRHPDLTPNEIKICSFLKLNMSTKDIAQLTGQSVAAIEMARYRIRRKLGISLDDHAHLSQYIMKI